MSKDLPKGWVRTTLGEVCAMNPGVTLHHLPPDDTEVSFVPMAAVEEESGRLHASQIRTLESVRRGYTPFKENDVIFAKITPCMENGKIALATGLKNGLAYGSTEFFVFRPYEGLLPRFVLYYLLQPSLREDAERQMSGAVGQKRVPSNYLFKHQFLLPPTPEQERIVAKLDAALSGLERAESVTRRAQERLQRYRAAVLHSAITGELTRAWREKGRKNKKAKPETGDAILQLLLATRRTCWEDAELHHLRAISKEPKDDKWKSRYREPVSPEVSQLPELPSGWICASIDQIASGETGAIQSGPFGSQLLHSEFVDSGILAIGIDNVLDGAFSLGRQHRITPKKYEGLKKFTARPLDVVVTVMATVGRVCVLPLNLETAIITKHCYRITTAKDWVNSDYLAFALRADASTRQHLFGSIHGLTRPGINGAILKAAPVPLPPIGEQLLIVQEVRRRLSAADRLAAALEQQLARARTTRQSLLSEAFAGRLIPQDPKDESASVVLARIRATREAEINQPKAKRMPKTNSKSKKARRPLLDVLQEHKNPMTPEQLFREAGFQASQVDLFYRELTSLRDKLREQKPKASAAKLWPHRADVLLQLKEGAAK